MLPTGALVIVNLPCASLVTGGRSAPFMVTVAPGIAFSALSNTMPLTVVAAAAPVTTPEEIKTAGGMLVPSMEAETELLLIPSS